MTDNAMTPAPKRRWLRFSLRTLFVVVTVFAMLAGVLPTTVAWLFPPKPAAKLPPEVITIIGPAADVPVPDPRTWIDRNFPATHESHNTYPPPATMPAW